MITMQLDEAWKEYILPHTKNPRWLEESKAISEAVPVSKRELLGLILLAHIQNHVHSNKNWIVGYDEIAPEPNDGFITNANLRIDVEHKIVPQMSTDDPLEGILSTYEKYSNKGEAYGGNRTLIIHANKASQGMIKVSSLKDKIDGDSPFERVLLMNAVTGIKNGIFSIHVTEHYPNFGIAQVDLNVRTGTAIVPHYGIK